MNSPEPEAEENATAQRVPRMGGRSARVVQSVHAAALKLLAEVGYDAMRMEAVAELAGIHKTSLYRRWPTKAALIIDALRALVVCMPPLPDTGALTSDLRAWLAQVVSSSDNAAEIMRARMLVMGVRDPAVQEEVSKIRAEGQQRVGLVIERAVGRGELPPSVDAALLLETLTAPIFFRLNFGQPIDEAYLDALIDLVVRGVS